METKSNPEPRIVSKLDPPKTFTGGFHLTGMIYCGLIVFTCLFLAIIIIFSPSNRARAQELRPIQLNAPDKNRGLPFMKALSVRASVREWSEEELSLQDLSDLLWAANGVNRPEKKMRTAPSPGNAQDIDVYVLMKEGAYLYDAFENVLKPIASGDFRKLRGEQFATNEPISLILVSDITRFRMGEQELRLHWSAITAGIVSQNISLFCAATGLGTVPRAGFDKEKVREILKLKDSQYPILNHPVGHLVK